MRRVIVVLLLLAVISLPILFVLGGRGVSLIGQRVALVDVTGVIAENAAIGGTTPRMFTNLLRRAEEDPTIKAVVVRVNSGGGSPAAAEEMYQAILRLREAGKPVVVSMGDVAASAAYYLSAAADRIVANPSSLTGSIGVISENFVFAELLGDLGVTVETVVSGPFKDIPSNFRPMTEDERAYWQQLINDVLETFIDAVARGRGLDEEYVRSLADGRLFTGRQAYELKLVDELGGLEDAILLAGRLAGIEGRPDVVPLQRPRPWTERLLQVAVPGAWEFSAAQLIQWLGIPPWGYQLR